MELTASLNEVCRTCLGGNGVELYTLHENNAEYDCLEEILLNCCDIQSDNKELPDKICMECKSVLLVFYKFKKRCQENDVFLRTYIKDNMPASKLNDTSISDKENIIPVETIPEQNKSKTEVLSSCDCREHCTCSENIENVEFSITEPFICKTCGKCFNKYKNLYRHQKIHDNKKQHLCAICGKSFLQYGNLQSHMRIHSGDRPYSCEHCSKSFAQWSTLRQHLVCHTRERAFVCSVCGKTFTRNSALSKHMNTHTDEKQYTCHLCNKKFKNSSEQVRHLVVHTGEKKYTCTVCGKTFNRASNLTVHKKIHTDNRPHACRVCNKRFIQLYVLNNHLKTHCS